MVIDLEVRRFRCANWKCEAATFTEQVPGVTIPHCRATPLWQNMATRVGFALAGRAGARLAAAIGMTCGRDTLLRRVHAHPDPPRGEVSVLGIDDFALRKRLRYATVLIDMDTRRPVDMLADRRGDATATLLRAHPETRIPCRDGSAAYAEAINRGALSLNTVKRYAHIAAPKRLVRAPAYRPTLVDPYREHLRRRRSEDPAIGVTKLLAEIKALGYQCSANLLARYINQGRVETDRPPNSPRGLTGLILTRLESLTDTQRRLCAELTTACPEMIELTDAVVGFAELLKPSGGNEKRRQEWITTVRSFELPYLHAFTRGLDKDKAAVAAGLPYSNGPTEGHVTFKTLKRQMYGRAGLVLLRILLAT